jgi:hypothetical protein
MHLIPKLLPKNALAEKHVFERIQAAVNSVNRTRLHPWLAFLLIVQTVQAVFDAL